MRMKMNRRVLMLVLSAVLLIPAVNALGAEPVKIKGFSIGMTIADALKNFERLGFSGLAIQEKTYRKTDTVYSISPGSGDRFLVQTGLNEKTVSKIHFTPGISDRLFQTNGIGPEIFAKTFVKAYDILSMEPLKDNPGATEIKGWEHYNLEHGYRIRIYMSKELEIVKTNKASEFSFD